MMGSTYAAGLAQTVEEGGIALEDAINLHLTVNHYPPVPRQFTPVALKALECASYGAYEDEIEMPNGLTRTAGQIIDGLHLEHFIRSYLDLED
jgi:hypothetical protein